MKDFLLLLRVLKGHIATYVMAFIFMALATGCYLLLPPQMGMLLQSLGQLGEGGDKQFFTVLPWIINATFLLFAAAIFGLSQALTITVVSEKIMNRLRLKFFNSIINRPLDHSKIKPSGEIASEFFSDLAIIQTGISGCMLDFARHLLFSIGSITALFIINPKMTGFALLSIGVVVLVILVLIQALKKSVLKIQLIRSNISSMLVEYAANAYVINAYSRIEYMTEKFRDMLKNARKMIVRHGILLALVSPLSLLTFSIILLFALIYSVKQVTNGEMAVNELITYFTYALFMVSSISQLSITIGQLHQSAAIAGKHADILNADLPSITPSSNAKNNPSQSPLSIKVVDVDFTYKEAASQTLQSVSLTIPARRVTAIIGESGSGKSTLAALLCGVFKPTAGKILISNGDLWQPLDKLTDQIAIVPQEPFLFTGSFYENISFGRSWISLSDAMRAAKRTGMHEFISLQSGGYDSIIEEGGLNLSRGQRQRIAIARAIVNKPDILILDEATASLDFASEQIIKRLILDIREFVTVIVIAHKGSILDTADKTIVVDRGQCIPGYNTPDFEQKKRGHREVV